MLLVDTTLESVWFWFATQQCIQKKLFHNINLKEKKEGYWQVYSHLSLLFLIYSRDYLDDGKDVPKFYEYKWLPPNKETF